MEYIKENENEILTLNEYEKNIQLIQNILKTQKDLAKAHVNFEYAEDELIDFYTYQIKALQSKLDYLTRVAKIKNIDYDIINKEVS